MKKKGVFLKKKKEIRLFVSVDPYIFLGDTKIAFEMQVYNMNASTGQEDDERCHGGIYQPTHLHNVNRICKHCCHLCSKHPCSKGRKRPVPAIPMYSLPPPCTVDHHNFTFNLFRYPASRTNKDNFEIPKMESGNLKRELFFYKEN